MLHRATADLPATDLSDAAAAATQRARRRRRATGVGTLVALVIAAVVLPAVLWPSPRPGPAPTPAPHDTGLAPVDPRSEEPWDPFTLAESPWEESLLPTRLDPPSSPPSVLTQPVPAVVLAWPEEGRDLRLFGTDGSWRRVPGSAQAVAGTLLGFGTPTLRPDGTSVAFPTNEGIRVIDIAEQRDSTLPWPDRIAGPWDSAPLIMWWGAEDLLVQHWRETWIMGLDGTARRAPRALQQAWLTVDPDGAAFAAHKVVDPEAGTFARVSPSGRTEVQRLDWWGARYAAGSGLIGYAGTSGPVDHRRSGLVVRRADEVSDIVGFLPIRSRASVYTDNGYATVLGFLDQHTALIKIAPMNFATMDADDETWYLVGWDLETGELTRLTEADSRLREVQVAIDLLP